MSNSVTKTPISYLQEYGVAKKMIPQYDLTYTGGTSHNPEFTFRVKVGDISEEGSGRSKQEAKHRAAEKMLKTLLNSEEKFKQEESVEMGEFKKEPVENFVGQLKDLCKTIHYPEPKYHLEEEAGPPHNKIFKMICSVSQLQEFGISKTIKQAKHQAASKMVQRLKEVGGKKIEDCLNNIETPNRIASSFMTDQEIVEKYYNLKSTNLTVTDYKDPAAKYKDNHNAYIILKEQSPTLNKVLSGSNGISVEKSLTVMENIAKELGVELGTVETPTKQPHIKFTIMTMFVTPPMAAIGVGKEQAAFNLLNSLLLLSKE